MGDMRTPDFDDLLAAFDIPDMVDPKAAIDSCPVDEIKLCGAQDESQGAQDFGIKVIVKNNQNKNSKRHLDPAPSNVASLNVSRFPTDNRLTMTSTSPLLNEYNPVTVYENERIEMEDSNNKHGSLTCSKLKHKQAEDNSKKERPQDRGKPDQNNNSPADAHFQISNCDQQQKELKDSETHETSRPVSSITAEKTSDKLSLSTATVTASEAKESSTDNGDTSDSVERENEPPRLSSQKDSCPESSRDPFQNLSKTKLTEDPSSIISDGNCQGSPDSITDKNLVIPKVCIKTTKTKTGQIKHSVTQVHSEDILKEAAFKDQDLKETNCGLFPSTTDPLPGSEVAIAAGFLNEVSKQVTMQPVATAFLPVSAVKTAGSQVINLKLANNTTVKATVIPASSMQSTNRAFLKVADTIQQHAATRPPSHLLNTKLTKSVHLGKLSLLPTTSSSEIQQTFTFSPKHQQEHQLQTIFTPTSKKASKLQVTESSPNAAANAFNNVLNGINPVPVYVPDLSPPSSACITLPSRGYKCLECGDSFALERSLAQHYGRRSVRIDVTCNQCAKSLVFYNKCSLLSHARTHKEKGKVMQCSHLVLKPIPADQMVTPSSSAAKHRTNLTPGSQDEMHALTAGDEASKPGQGLTCFDCKKAFQDVGSLAAHYQRESDGQRTCSVCQMVLPNQCSFLSHQRIHKDKPPFICPECGASCPSAHSQSHHITKTCLHYARHNGYRCVHCSVILADSTTLKGHIQSTHCEIFYKCFVCPMAFKSAPGTHSHSCTQHPGVKVGEPKLIYKCAMCDTVFTLQSLLYTHLDQHVSTQRVSVFQCPDCSTNYTQKQLLLDHIKVTHGTLKSHESSLALSISHPLSTRSTNYISNRSNSNIIKESKDKDLPKSKTSSSREINSPSKNRYTCAECGTDFYCAETYVGHMKKKHAKVLKKNPCHQCEKSFCSMLSLCRHILLKHKVFSCPQCPALSQPFTKRILLEQHVQLVHGGQKWKTVGTHIVENAPIKEMTRTKQKRDDDEVSVAVNCCGPDSQPLKKLKVNISKVQRCAVCGFNTEDKAAFHDHIPQHKSNGSSYQCRECGLCYTSPRSLSRHLFIVHRLREPYPPSIHHRQDMGGDESQRENRLNSVDENDDGTPNTRCKVCSREFESEVILNTHMRTHGMAFITAKASKLRAGKQ